MDEELLIANAKKGDEAAFAALLELHQGKVYGLTLRLTGSPEDAMELTQETFFNAWRGLPGFQGESKFSTWLYRLATNVSIDFLRREKRRRSLTVVSLSEEEDGKVYDIPDQRFTPQSELERKELQEAVRRGLDRLSDDHRRILVLRELNGLSYAEISQVLDLEEGTVKSRIARARLALRKVLLEDGNFSVPQASYPTNDRKGGPGYGL